MNIKDRKLSETVVIIGGGPAGLMAAEVLLESGFKVELYDAMPSIGRKFLRAGKGGLNLTHSEPYHQFLSRYGQRRQNLEPIIEAFSPTALQDWAHHLGIKTFVGSSGRVFPENLNSVSILRKWIARLKKSGLQLFTRHKWLGWEDGYFLSFETPSGKIEVETMTVILALGGGSWPQLGSDGAWVSIFNQKGIFVQPLKPANCGFNVEWTDHFWKRYHGKPVKPVVITLVNSEGQKFQKKGEFIITESGIEGSLIYAFSSLLRNKIEAKGIAMIELDMAPDWTFDRLVERLSQPRGSRSIASHLKKATGIEGVKAGLLREFLDRDDLGQPEKVASAIKGLPIKLISPRPLEESISSAGGVPFEALDQNLMVQDYPGMFCAGEMLDWEAPTGGYLLTACFATGRWVGKAAASWLSNPKIAYKG